MIRTVDEQNAIIRDREAIIHAQAQHLEILARDLAARNHHFHISNCELQDCDKIISCQRRISLSLIAPFVSKKHTLLEKADTISTLQRQIELVRDVISNNENVSFGPEQVNISLYVQRLYDDIIRETRMLLKNDATIRVQQQKLDAATILARSKEEALEEAQSIVRGSLMVMKLYAAI